MTVDLCVIWDHDQVEDGSTVGMVQEGKGVGGWVGCVWGQRINGLLERKQTRGNFQ